MVLWNKQCVTGSLCRKDVAAKPMETKTVSRHIVSPSSSSRPSVDTTGVNKHLGLKPKRSDESDTKPVAKGKAYLDKAGKVGRKTGGGGREGRSTPVSDWGSPSYHDDHGGSKRRHKKDKGGPPG